MKSGLRANSTLVVGDIHATADELPDCQALIDGIVSLKKKYSTVVFLGDQFHTHSVLSLQVVDFWRNAVTVLKEAGYRQIYLRGNHDMAANGEGPNALEVFRELLGNGDCIVTGGYEEDGVLFLAHQVVQKNFEKLVHSKLNPDLLVCHQTFEGAQYENGFYAPDGIDQNVVPSGKIISGHVHKNAQLGKVFYPGSPRWRSASDAGEHKALFGFPDGMVGEKVVVHPTSAWCTPIEIVDDTENKPFERQWANSKLTVIVKGSPEFVKARAATLESQDFAVRRRPDLRASAKVSESQPIGTSMTEFMKSYRGARGTPGDRLAAMAAQRFA